MSIPTLEMSRLAPSTARHRHPVNATATLDPDTPIKPVDPWKLSEVILEVVRSSS